MTGTDSLLVAGVDSLLVAGVDSFLGAGIKFVLDTCGLCGMERLAWNNGKEMTNVIIDEYIE